MTRQEEKLAAIEQLRELLRPGDIVYTALRNRADEYRAMHVLAPSPEAGKHIVKITELVCAAAGFRLDRRFGALGIGGRFSTDEQAGEAVVSRLSEVLFGVGKNGLKHQLL